MTVFSFQQKSQKTIKQAVSDLGDDIADTIKDSVETLDGKMCEGSTVEKLAYAFAYGSGTFFVWLCALGLDRVFRCEMIAKLELMCNNPVVLALVVCMRCFTKTRYFAGDSGKELSASEVIRLRQDQTVITSQPNLSDHSSP